MSKYLQLIVFSVFLLYLTAEAFPPTINGFVTDSTSGEGLIGANVYLDDLPLGISTSEEGYYVLHPIPPGRHTLKVSFIGFKTFSQVIELKDGEKKFLNIALIPEAVQGDEVIVSAESETNAREIQISQVELSAKNVRDAPQLAEADLFRTLQALPGVVAESDFSTGLVVRGGNTDQNLIMLDGITVYNPSHMGGLFSNFLLDATKDALFIKGGFPAEYGGRMSSVLNVISKSGNMKHYTGSVGVSLLSSRLSMEIPVRNGSLLLAGRRTYFDQVLKMLDKEFPYYFYDFQGSFFQDLSPYDRLSISGYFGNDVLDWDRLNFKLNWGNRTISSNWRHVFSPQLFSNFMLATSKFKTSVLLGGDQGVNSTNDVIDYTISGDLSYLHSGDHISKFGFEVKKLTFNYQDIYDNRTLFRLKQAPTEISAYFQNDWKINSTWIVKPGLRVSYFSKIKNSFYLEPRFALKYKLRTGEYLTYATGLYRQFIFTVQDEYNPTFINSWFAIDKTVPTGRSLHNIIGYERELWSTTTLEIELYHKTLDNMLTYRESRSSVDEELGDDVKANELFVPSNGYSYGIELFLHKKYGQLAGWIGYTLNWAKKTLDGDTYYASFDRRHNIDLLLSYDVGRNWRLGIRFNYGSGFPFTRAIGSYEERDGNLVTRRLIYGKRNRFRYPAYHRLDLSMTKYFKWLGLDWQLDFQTVNAYNRENVFFYEWDFDQNPAEQTVIPMLPLIPTLGISTNF
ncbi:MAG: TonB-dependent receptor [Calditrichota bacterium]